MMTDPARPALEIRVECYAGHCGEETPRRFSFDGQTIEVTEVLDAWLAPDHRYFKVRGDDKTISMACEAGPGGSPGPAGQP
jgi:hypothetical protein